MASIIRQFALLAWKNWLLTRRRPVVTGVELLMPLLVPAVMLALRPLVAASVAATPTHYRPFGVRRLPPDLVPPLLRRRDVPASAAAAAAATEGMPPRNVWLVAYAPDVEIAGVVMNVSMTLVNTIYFPAINHSVPFYHAVRTYHTLPSWWPRTV